jgi:uncharacterized protein
MSNGNPETSRQFGVFILRFRQAIGLLLAAITLFMAYWAFHVPIATNFEDLFPANHPSTLLYRKFRRQYGGAQTLVLMLRMDRGDIFNFKTLHDIQDITAEVNALPGVNHNEVFSLASYRLLYARAVPGGLISTPFMYPKVPQTQAQLAELKNNVRAHREQLASFVTFDEKGALTIASFNERDLDYKVLFDDVQRIIQKYQRDGTRVYASGAVMFSAWGYHYLPRIQIIFAASIVLMLVILYLSLGRRSGWWASIVTGLCSTIWGLGFVGLMGFNFDPVMLVIPFILTARDLSHGIQWHGRYYDELDRTEDKLVACAATADAMLAPGVLAVLANIAGIIFIATSDIPVLRQIGLGGAVWLGASLAMVFVFQPVLMTYLPRPRVRDWGWLNRWTDRSQSSNYSRLTDWLVALPTTSGVTRSGLIVVGLVAMAVGLGAARQVRVGYQTTGTPIYRPDAKVNQDTAEIGRFVPTNLAWVVLETPNFPSPQSNIGTKTLRVADDLGNFLVSRGDAIAVLSFSALAEKPMNMLLHNGFPKYLSLPDTDILSANLWNFFFGSSAPDEPQSYFAYSPAMTNACIRILLKDHTGSRLSKLRADLDYFVRQRVSPDPELKNVKIHYVGGDAGLYLATNDVISRLNRVNLALTLAAILLAAAVIFRSVAAGLIFALASIMASFCAFLYMTEHNLGLTVDTISVISLGIGLGISYGIYTVARIKDEVVDGLPVDTAITTALRSTGAWVVSTFAVMVGGTLPWVFSPLLFHNEMSVLLIILMTTNLIVGLLILPAIVAWLRPRFIARYEWKEREFERVADTPR